MAYFEEAEADEPFERFSVFPEYFGFVPKLFRAQALLPRLVEAEAALCAAILFERSRTNLPSVGAPLLDFATKLGTNGPSISPEDIARLFAAGVGEDSVLEAVLLAGWGN